MYDLFGQLRLVLEVRLMEINQHFVSSGIIFLKSLVRISKTGHLKKQHWNLGNKTSGFTGGSNFLLDKWIQESWVNEFTWCYPSTAPFVPSFLEANIGILPLNMTCDQIYIGFDWGYVTNALVGMFTRCTYLKWGPSVKIHQIKHLWGWSLKWVARISTSSQLSTLTHWHMSWNGKSSKRSEHEKCIETTIFTVELPHDTCWNRLAAALGSA